MDPIGTRVKPAGVISSVVSILSNNNSSCSDVCDRLAINDSACNDKAS